MTWRRRPAGSGGPCGRFRRGAVPVRADCRGLRLRAPSSASNALVADIGGGYLDFLVVRVGPERMGRLIAARTSWPIMAYTAGTDFDRHIELASIPARVGYRVGPGAA